MVLGLGHTMPTTSVVLFAYLYTQTAYCSYYNGPTAKPVVLHNGYLADTHEVAAAKNAHLTTLGQHNYGSNYGFEGSYGEEHSGSHGDIRYHGPTAIPHVLHDGHIADTHEVAAAKAEHFAAVAKAKAHGGHGDHYSVRYASGSGADHGHSHDVVTYHGPFAKPVVLKSGYLADTHEVAAAKAEHFAAVAKAKAHGGYGDHYSGGYASGSGTGHGHSHHVVPYHGPLAMPVVLKSGYLADTHEVATAKAEHFAAVAKAKAHGGYGDHHSGGYASGSGAGHGHSHHVVPYHGPLAKPVVLKSGYLADTHEVAAAREHHLEALHGANQHGYYDRNY